MPAQRKRILVAGRQVADPEHAHQRFQLVGQRHDHAGHVAGQLVAGKAGLVMVFDGDGDVLGEAVMARVIAAHDALQLGEFAHHVGQQVGLGQLGCGVGALCQDIAAELLANGLGDGAHALHPLALRAQLVVIDHLAQALNPRSQGFLAILVEEELGVGQARAHHPLVAADHGTGIVRTDVADHEELVRQLALCIQQREVFLVGLHREDEAFLRHVEELLFKRADEHIGPLDQRRHFVEQGLVIDRLAAPADLGRGRGQLARDLGATTFERSDHRTVLGQRVGIAVGILQDHRIHGRLEAVAMGGRASGQTQRLDGHHGRTVHRHQPVGRAHKLHAAPAGQLAIGLQLVGHDLGNGQLGNRLVQRLLQASGQRHAGRDAVEKQGFGFAVGRTLELRHHRGIGPQRTQALEQRRRGLAIGRQAHAHRHELLRHRLVGGARDHIGHMRGQPAR